jgi:iron complex transport system substrate-binding protein
VRIVSLLPSATEIVCALGAGDELVARSHECDFPSTIIDRPALTSARIAVGASSLAIDRAVRDVIANALSIYSIDDEQLAEVEPDVIITQDLCEVCAVSLDDVRSAVARLAGDHVQIVSLSPTRLEHVMQTVEDVARAIGRTETGRRVRAQLEQRIRSIAKRAATATTRPRVITLEWLEPLMIGGTWMPELVELAHGNALGATAGAPAPTIDRAELAELAPDVIVVKPCGFSIERTLEERGLVAQIVATVPTARVYIADGNAYFNRPGPRLVESLEILAACIHPELFAAPDPDDCIRM